MNNNNITVELTPGERTTIIADLRYSGGDYNRALAARIESIQPTDPADDGPEVDILRMDWNAR